MACESKELEVVDLLTLKKRGVSTKDAIKMIKLSRIMVMKFRDEECARLS